MCCDGCKFYKAAARSNRSIAGEDADLTFLRISHERRLVTFSSATGSTCFGSLLESTQDLKASTAVSIVLRRGSIAPFTRTMESLPNASFTLIRKCLSSLDFVRIDASKISGVCVLRTTTGEEEEVEVVDE
eukprot:m.332799 g.332799  ORF g.332799 m.332799 type:complete len:131 (-) comp17008_c0_seq1:523-915(-)